VSRTAGAGSAQRRPGDGKFDVLVAGGGAAGVVAGIAAARRGAETLIVEQSNCLGGMATAGGHGHICLYSAWGTDQRIVGGIVHEIAERVSASGFGTYDGISLDFDIEGMKLLLEEMALESGVNLLYHTLAMDCLGEGQDMAVVLGNKGGSSQVAARRVIDCSGDGDLAARSGCEYQMGEKASGLCQPATLMFTLGGVDHDRLDEYLQEDPRLVSTIRRAQAEGGLGPFQTHVMGFWWTPARPTHLGVNFTHINEIDGTDAWDLTRGTIVGRKQAFETAEFLRRYVPGMENCYIVSTASSLGVRESRRMLGEYVLTKEDLLVQREFPDSIGYGSFFIDIHNLRGPGMDPKSFRPPPGFKYQIPYRVLVPRGAENLLVAGRCVSCTHEALGSLRVMPQCGVMGEAAGTAAALSIQSQTSPRDLDPTRLREVLRSNGCIVDARDVDRPR
jgi:hypothetical protein